MAANKAHMGMKRMHCSCSFSPPPTRPYRVLFSAAVGVLGTTAGHLHQRSVDLLILNGRVVDTANGLDGLYDIAVDGGEIIAVEPQGSLALVAAETFDATGLLVTPGLVDIHAHGFQHVEPIGLDFDASCLQRCTTTVVDAGSSGAT